MPSVPTIAIICASMSMAYCKPNRRLPPATRSRPRSAALYLGDNRSTLLGSNGTGNSADGALDEFRIYNYEGGSALVLRDFNAGGAGCLSHYSISHSGSGLNLPAKHDNHHRSRCPAWQYHHAQQHHQYFAQYRHRQGRLEPD